MKASGPTAAELLEREYEFDQLAAAIDAALGGDGSTVALEGEAGIGKTSLLTYATRRACDAGMRVFSARGGELEREFAYGVVRQLFEAPLTIAGDDDRQRWLGGAAGLAAPVVSALQAAHGAGPDPSSILHGLYWLSANVSADQPLVIAVDDAQWADDASIAFLSYLARRADELPILLVYASRVGEGAADELPAVTDPGLVARVLRPDALSDAATAELVGQRFGRDGSEDFARACRAATSGNPFLLNELLRALAADQIAPDDASTRRVEQIAPKTIARATLARLRRLGPAAKELAFAAAVLGRSADLRYAGALAGLDEAGAVNAADALAAAAILRDVRPLEFIHPVVRTTIYDELAPGKRCASHKQAARLLASDGAGDVTLAPHLLATEPAGDPWVVERLRGAAQEVRERGAPDAACTYLLRAEREPAPACERLDLLYELGSVELDGARPAALDHLLAVVDGARDPELRLKAARDLLWALKYVDRSEESAVMGAEVLASIPDGDDDLRLRFEGDLAAAAQFTPSSAKAALERLEPYEGKLRGETSGERLVLACLAFGSAHRGESAEATAQLARLALADGRLMREPRQGGAAYYLAVWALVYADELEEAERYFDLAVEVARRSGSVANFGAASGCRCQVLVRQGRLAEAEAEALGVLDSIEPHAIARSMLLASVVHTMAERADAQAGETFLREHGMDGDLSGKAMGGMLMLARGHLRLAGGDPALALRDFERLRRRDEVSGLDTPGMPSRASAALAHAQLGDRVRAGELAREEVERARVWNTPSSLSVALRTAGIVEGGDVGLELMREAVATGQNGLARYEHTRSLVEFGAALRRLGHRRDARAPLREALELADRCGALRTAARAREELLATGARPRRAALSGVDSLTPSERRVAGLAADGLSNRDIAQALFVTLRTVEGHLTQSYTKLDIASREELARALSPRSAA